MDKVKVPPKAFKKPVERIPDDASDRKYHRALKRSGLVRMMELMYPQENSQHN